MEWISVDELVPNSSDLCVGYDVFSGTITLCRFIYDDEGGTFESMAIHEMQCDFSVTHWTPIYNLPEIED